MPRSVNAVPSRKRRKKVLKAAKGFFGARSKVYTVAKNALDKAYQYAYVGRKRKKRDFRRIWIQRINAAARAHNMSYSEFIYKLKNSNIELNRKVLADLAIHNTEAFGTILKQIG